VNDRGGAGVQPQQGLGDLPDDSGSLAYAQPSVGRRCNALLERLSNDSGRDDVEDAGVEAARKNGREPGMA